MAGAIRLGTSSFTANGWNGSFYPKGMKSADYLGYYSSRFDTSSGFDLLPLSHDRSRAQLGVQRWLPLMSEWRRPGSGRFQESIYLVLR
jgi:hypothetical protein